MKSYSFPIHILKIRILKKFRFFLVKALFSSLRCISALLLLFNCFVVLRSHELRVRILRELIREVNLAKSTREHDASSLLLRKEWKRRYIYIITTRAFENTLGGGKKFKTSSHFLFRRISKCIDIIKIRNVIVTETRVFLQNSSRGVIEEKFQSSAAEIKDTRILAYAGYSQNVRR